MRGCVSRLQVFKLQGKICRLQHFLEMKACLFWFACLVLLGFVSPNQEGMLFTTDLILKTLFLEHQGYVFVRVF